MTVWRLCQLHERRTPDTSVNQVIGSSAVVVGPARVGVDVGALTLTH